MAGKNRLMARLVASSATVTPDSDYIATNLTKTQAQAASLSVYSSIDSLPTSASTGAKALVTSTNTLYIYNNGWYKIAIINAFNPQWITQPNGSYALAIDGSTTSITVLASDSDDVPITYTAITDSNFDAFATVTHDSDKHNVWTVTPTDSENGSATNGTGTVTFKASDGVNLVSAVSTFTLSFVTTNSRYTTLLLYADSDSNDNQVDATSNHTITESGGLTSSSFSPFHPGGYSVEFDGTDDGLSFGTTSTFKFLHDKTVNYTIEGWLYSTDNSTRRTIFATDTSSGASGVLLENNSGYFRYVVYTGTGGVFTLVNGPAISLNTWHHFAVTFDGTSIRIFKDGVLDSDTTWSLSGSTSNQNFAASIGKDTNGVIGDMSGYIADFRIVNGSTVYSSNFTAPTKRLTAISGTSLLACHLPYIADGSSNNHSITVTGNISTQRVSPYDYSSYSKTTHLGSVTFDGTDDYLSVNDSTDLDFGTGDWTVECWLYKTGAFKNYDSPWSKFVSNNGYWLHINSTGNILLGTSGSNWATSTETIRLENWHHIATVRSSGVIKVYLDGVATSISLSYSGNNDNNTPFLIGVINGYNRYTQGFISDFRVVKGTAVYTSNFTPPAQPLTAISGTSLLTCTNKSDVWDHSGSYTIADGGGATESRGFAKFADDDSVQFTGNINTWLRIGTSYKPLNWLNDDELSVGTFEAWIYQTAQGNGALNYTAPSILGWGGTYLNFGVEGSQLRFYYWTGTQNQIDPSGATISLNTWHHVAFSNDSSNNLRIFLDGTLVHTISSFPGVAYASAGNGEYIYLGTESQSTSSRFTGYIYNARITEGLARYTANFTVPSAPLQG